MKIKPPLPGEPWYATLFRVLLCAAAKVLTPSKSRPKEIR